MNRSLRRLLGVVAAVTLVAHTVLAVGIVVHARVTDRDDGTKWALATLVGGLVGVAGYARADD